MSTPAIAVRGLGKTFPAPQGEQYQALRDLVSLRRKGAGGVGRAPSQPVVALEDVSFDVPVGQVLGVVGGNGAGKSTLFKILSRITAPSAGEIRLRGQIGALLEVGTGFHPELTGRENAFLNGAILGMSRKQLAARLDAIVDFAEIEHALDRPVKQYSIGMYMRLAFSVAAHLEPDVLLVDEVLAVGDVRFREKCLGKIATLGRSGRTVLFVSHQLDAVRQVCDRCVLLRGGHLVDDGDPATVLDGYLRGEDGTLVPGVPRDLRDAPRHGSGEARITSLELEPGEGDAGPRLVLGIESAQGTSVRSVGLTVATEGGFALADVDPLAGAGGEPLAIPPGASTLALQLGPLALVPGRYRLGVRLANPITVRSGSGAVDMIDLAGFLQVDGDPDLDGSHGSSGPLRLASSLAVGR